MWAAFLLEKKTLLPTSYWVDDENLPDIAARQNLDDFCNLSILTFGRLVNILAKGEDRTSTAEPNHHPQKLWEDFQSWWENRPKRARPLFRTPPTRSNPFATIVFIDPSSSEYFSALDPSSELQSLGEADRS